MTVTPGRHLASRPSRQARVFKRNAGQLRFLGRRFRATAAPPPAPTGGRGPHRPDDTTAPLDSPGPPPCTGQASPPARVERSHAALCGRLSQGSATRRQTAAVPGSGLAGSMARKGVWAAAFVLGWMSRAAQGQTDNDILNFALQLECVEAEFFSYAAFGVGLSASLLGGGEESYYLGL